MNFRGDTIICPTLHSVSVSIQRIILCTDAKIEQRPTAFTGRLPPEKSGFSKPPDVFDHSGLAQSWHKSPPFAFKIQVEEIDDVTKGMLIVLVDTRVHLGGERAHLRVMKEQLGLSLSWDNVGSQPVPCRLSIVVTRQTSKTPAVPAPAPSVFLFF